MPVPKVIHFIWAGGDNPFPDNKTLQTWREQNPDFEIILWVDKETTNPKVIKEYTNSEGPYQYQDIGSQSNLIELLKHQSGEEVSKDPKSIKIMDIREAGLCKKGDPADYEIRRFESNYGSSSDILRYRILTELGGAYFDADIDPGKIPLSKYSEVFDSSDPVFKFSTFAQGQEDAPGNDAFICSPKHPLMGAIWKRSMDNYTRKAKVPIHPDTYEGPESFDHTLDRTGPGCVSKVLTEKEIIIESEEEIKVNPKVILDRDFFSPRPQNTRNWVNIPIKKSDNIEHALYRVSESMEFEAGTMGIVRFAKHTRDMLRSLRVDFDAHLQDSCKTNIAEAIMNLTDKNYNKAGSKLLKELLEVEDEIESSKETELPKNEEIEFFDEEKKFEEETELSGNKTELSEEQEKFFKICKDPKTRAKFIAEQATGPSIIKLADYYELKEAVGEYLTDRLGVPWTEAEKLCEHIENEKGWENQKAVIATVEEFVQSYIENLIKMDVVKNWLSTTLAAPEDKVELFGFDRKVQKAIRENNLDLLVEKIAQYFIRPETLDIEKLVDFKNIKALQKHAIEFIKSCDEKPPKDFEELMKFISTSNSPKPSPMERKLGQILYKTQYEALSKFKVVKATEDEPFIKDMKSFGMSDIIHALGGVSTSTLLKTEMEDFEVDVKNTNLKTELEEPKVDVSNTKGDNLLHGYIRKFGTAEQLSKVLEEYEGDLVVDSEERNEAGLTPLELAKELYPKDVEYIEELQKKVSTFKY